MSSVETFTQWLKLCMSSTSDSNDDRQHLREYLLMASATGRALGTLCFSGAHVYTLELLDFSGRFVRSQGIVRWDRCYGFPGLMYTCTGEPHFRSISPFMGFWAAGVYTFEFNPFAGLCFRFISLGVLSQRLL